MGTIMGYGNIKPSIIDDKKETSSASRTGSKSTVGGNTNESSTSQTGSKSIVDVNQVNPFTIDNTNDQSTINNVKKPPVVYNKLKQAIPTVPNKLETINNSSKLDILENLNPFESLSLKMKEEQEKMDTLRKAQRTKAISDQMGSGSDFKRKSQFDFNNGKSLEEQQRDLEVEFLKNQNEYNQLLNTPSPFKI